MGIRYLDEPQQQQSRIKYLDAPQQQDSVATQGASYFGNHPFKAAFDPIAKTLTGKTLSQRLEDKTAMRSVSDSYDMYGNNPIARAKNIFENTAQGTIANVAEGFTAPVAAVGGLVSKIPGVQQAGRAIAQSKFGQGVGRIMNAPLEKIPSKAKDFATNLITGPEKAQAAANEAKFALNQDTSRKIAETKRIGNIKLDIANRNADAASQGYDNLSETLKKQVVKESDKQGLDLQKNLPKVFGQKSAEYGAKQESIVSSLSDNERTIPAEKVVSGMEDVLKKFGILRTEPSGQVIVARAPMTPTEHQIFGLYEHNKKFHTINVEDLMKTQKYIEPSYGKAWSPDDKLSADVARKFSDITSEAVPALRALKKEYAPFLEWKNAAIDQLKPFNSQYDVATSVTAKGGSTKIVPAEQRLMSVLQKHYESPHGTRIKSLNEGIQKTAVNKEQSAIQAQLTIKNLRSSIAKDLQQIRQDKVLKARDIEQTADKLVQKYKTQRVLVSIGAGGLLTVGSGLKALEYFVRRETYSGLHGRY